MFEDYIFVLRDFRTHSMQTTENQRRSTNSQIKQSGVVHSSIDLKSLPASPALDVNLSSFSEEERMAILSVVKRDLEVRHNEQHRLKKIRNRILKQDSHAPLLLPGKTRVCVLCKEPFMIFFNPTMTCSLCRREICKNCSKTYDNEVLCRICSHDISYRAMVCNWFYETPTNASLRYASDTIIRSVFKDKLQGINDFNDDQLYRTVSNYLRPESRTYVNGRVYTPEVLRKKQNDQIVKFGKQYQEIRSVAMKALSKVRSDSAKYTPEEVDREIEKITQQFIQQTKEAIRKLLQMLCITEERYKVSSDSPVRCNTSVRVLELTQRQVESLVGHKIRIPDEYIRSEADEELDSYVASVAGGPEEFFADVLLEDLKHAVQTSQSNGKLSQGFSNR
nr:synaptotagmin protein 4 [Hymenolepis microstoma]